MGQLPHRGLGAEHARHCHLLAALARVIGPCRRHCWYPTDEWSAYVSVPPAYAQRRYEAGRTNVDEQFNRSLCWRGG